MTVDSDQMRQVEFSWNISVLVKKEQIHIDSISFDSVFCAIRIYTGYKFMVQFQVALDLGALPETRRSR